MKKSSVQRFRIAADRVRRERDQLTSMCTKMKKSSVTSESIRREIMRVVCEVFDVTTEEIVGPVRHKRVAVARHAYCTLVSSLDPLGTMVHIGEMLGGRNHSTIINSIRKCNNLRETDLTYASCFQRCIELLSNSTDAALMRINFQPEQIQSKNTERQRQLQQALGAIDLVKEFMRIWDNEVLHGGFPEDDKKIIASFNDLRTKATQQGF